MVEIRIVYHCDSTVWNEQVYLVGSINELGNWNIENGVKLLTDASSFPKWTATVILPSNITFEYKYLIVDTNTFEIKRWESLPTSINRKMTVKQKGIFTAYEREGSTETTFNKVRMTKRHSEVGKHNSKRKKSPTKRDLRAEDQAKTTTSKNAKMMVKNKYNEDINFESRVLHVENLNQDKSIDNKVEEVSVPIKVVEDDFNKHLKKQNSANLIAENQDYHFRKLISTPGSSSDDEGNKGAKLIRTVKDLEKRILSYQDIRAIDKIDGSDDSEKKDINQSIVKKNLNMWIEDIRENIEEEIDFDIAESDVAIIVCIVLPFYITRNSNGVLILQQTNSILYSKVYNRDQDQKYKEWWIGWTSYFPKDEEEKKEVIQLFREKNCIPIIWEESVISEYFSFYEKQVIPLFHNFKTHFEYKESYELFDNWGWYKSVNKMFSDCICNIIDEEVESKNKSAIIWINNQHLILTPKYIREKKPNVPIGLFLHSPFPASEIFKLIPYRQSLLKAMLSWDWIGFHSFEYARNFFLTVKRLLGINFEYRRTGQIAIDNHGRNVSLVISHIGVNYDSIYQQVTLNSFKKSIKAVPKSKRIIISYIDTLSQIAGIKEKLFAYQKFLRSDPSHAKNCKLIQYLEPTSYGKLYKANQYHLTVMRIKDEIIKEFGNQVLSIKIEPLSERLRMLLWARTDILFNTTLKGGLCLLSLEYIAVRCILGKQGKSCIVLSEFAEGTRVLSGAIKWNPYSIQNTAQALERGFNMNTKEKAKNMESMLIDVIKYSTKHWANSFLKDIKVSNKQLDSSFFLGLTSEVVKHRLIHQVNTMPLDLNEFVNAYANSSNRLIIIDTKGIVVPKNQGDIVSYETTSCELSETIIRLLDSLSRYEMNKFWVISPYRKEKIVSQLRKIERFNIRNINNINHSSKLKLTKHFR